MTRTALFTFATVRCAYNRSYFSLAVPRLPAHLAWPHRSFVATRPPKAAVRPRSPGEGSRAILTLEVLGEALLRSKRRKRSHRARASQNCWQVREKVWRRDRRRRRTPLLVKKTSKAYSETAAVVCLGETVKLDNLEDMLIHDDDWMN